MGFLIFFATFFFQQPQSAPGSHLARLIVELYENNPQYRAAFHRWEAAEAEAETAGAWADPNLNLGLYAREVETRVGPQKQVLGLSQKIPWHGKRKLAKNMAGEMASAARSRLDAVGLALVTELKSRYAEFYFLGRSIAITEDHLTLLQTLESVVAERYRTSAAQYNDLIRIQVEIDKLGDRLAGQRQSARPLAASLNALLGREPASDFSFPEALGHPEIPEEWSVERLLAQIPEENPNLKALAHQVQADLAGLAIAEKNRYPDFQVGVDWINTGSAIMPNVRGSGDDPIVLRFGINLPIWRKKLRAAERAAGARLAASEQTQLDMDRQLEARLAKAAFQLEDAARKIRLYRDRIIPKARESLDVTLNGFQTGDSSYSELIDAEQALLEFLLSLTRAEADRAIALSAMEAVIGAPPFQTMDPNPAEPSAENQE